MREFIIFLFILTLTKCGVAFAAEEAGRAVANVEPTYSILTFASGENIQLPEVANRKGSKRVGGTNSKGKGSRYSGSGRK